MSDETIYDLAYCTPDSPFDGAQLSERVKRYSHLDITPEECQRQVDEFWARIHAAPSVLVKRIRL